MTARPAADVEIRRAAAEDLDLLAPMVRDLWRHLSASPIYIPLLQSDRRSDDERWLAEEDHAIWIAFRSGRPVGHIRLEPSEQLVLPTSDDSIIACTGAYTAPDARGAGVGAALLAHAMEWARSQGYARVSVDFESANIPGSAFWLGSGFRPICTSLKRVVDERSAWANPTRSNEDLMRAYEGKVSIG